MSNFKSKDNCFLHSSQIVVSHFEASNQKWALGPKGLFTWRTAAAVKSSAPFPALTPPSLPGDASHSPVAGVVLPLARGSTFLAADKRKAVNSQQPEGLKGSPKAAIFTAHRSTIDIPFFWDET